MQQGGLFEHGDEAERGQYAVLWVNPACQCLLLADQARARTHDGLVVGPNPSLVYGLVQAFEDVDANLCLGPHLVGEPHEVRPPGGPVEVAGGACAVEAHLDDVVPLVAQVQPGTQRRHVLEVGRREALENAPGLLLDALLRCERVEVVLAEAGARVLAEGVGEQSRERAQRLVATVVAIAFDIMGMKAFNTRYGRSEGDRLLCALADALRAAIGRVFARKGEAIVAANRKAFDIGLEAGLK